MIDTQAIRSKILDLAMRGQLTEQLPADGNAEDLFQQIQAGKHALIKAKRIKKEEHLLGILDEELPYEIPKNWKWVRLGDFGSWHAGATPSRGNSSYYDGSIPWLKTGDLNDGLITRVSEHITELALKECSVQLNPVGSVLIAMYGATIGKLGIAQIPLTTNQACCACAPYKEIYNRYLFYLLMSMRKTFIDMGIGGAQSNISREKIVSTIVPLPPLAEQRRIVEKIEQTFSVLDTIDELQKKYADNMAVLKSKLVDLAIQGKLTEQLPEDGTAEELYQQIQTEKQALIKAGKIKKEKPLPEINESEIPFEIPNNWKWVRWGNLSYQIQYGYNAPAKEKGRIKMVRITDIQNNRVLWDTVPFCDIDEENIEEYLLKPNNILFARTGGTVGKSFLVKTIEQEAVFAGYLIRTSFNSNLNAKYLKFFMESSLYWKQLQDGTTATAQPNCNANTLSKMTVPLPPLAEQKRIVESLDSINGIIRIMKN